jgi:photosystem II stability/assembly factor-like uncharacterized protein
MENQNNQNLHSGNKHFLIQIIITLVIVFIISCSSVFSQAGWFSQPLPVTGQVQDLKFFDANTGLIAMTSPALIMRTTNGGYNWDITLPNQNVGNFEIIDSNIVYARGSGYSIDVFLFRSSNRGVTWDSLPVSNAWTSSGISFINKDTGWVGGTSGGVPFLWYTTNAGLNWTVNSTVTGRGKVFFLKYKVNGEYIGWSMDNDVLYKTTNSGVTWVQIQSNFNLTYINFINDNTGWVADYNSVKKTTNGGSNWNTYYMPTGNQIFWDLISSLKIINKDTLYGDKGARYFGDSRFRGIIWVSTNGGVNWGFQQPDTSINRPSYIGIDFANKNTGWSSWIRTNDGGGPIIITGINNQITTKPELFILEQNYPNPFNSSTRINFSISKPSYITLTVFDITGKEVLKIYNNEFFTAGNYFAGIDIGKMGLSSGMYIYRMTAADLQSKNVFTESKKLVYLK